MGPRNAVLGGGDASEMRNGRLRRSSLWGHETCEGCAEMGRWRHANFPTGAFGGAPYGATKRVRGLPKWARVHMRTLPREPSAELPVGSLIV